MKIQFDCYPEGKKKAVTLSYDDGRGHDRQLVDIINRFGIRGSFHLNSGLLGKSGYIDRSEVRELYAGHEISAHTATHPFLTRCPIDRIADEIQQDRRELELLAAYPVRGMSYPHGDWNEQIAAMLPVLGIEYARTTNSHSKFHMPENFLTWSPTCHHRDMLECGQRFMDNQIRHPAMSLLYVWGHSYEFHNHQNWDQLERFCEMVGGRSEVWYATNIEVVLYRKALRDLRFSVSGQWVHNPSAMSVWFSANGDIVEVKPGQVLQLC